MGEGRTPVSGALYEPESEIFSQSPDSVTKKGEIKFIWEIFDLKELHSIFWSKNQLAEISQPEQSWIKTHHHQHTIREWTQIYLGVVLK